MVQISVEFWGYPSRTTKLDVDSGLLHPKYWFLSTRSTIRRHRGFACRRRGITYALYATDAGGIFQVGSRKWNIREHALRIEHRNEARLNRFIVSWEGKVEVNVTYKAYRWRWYNRIDSSFDEMDEEEQDFLLWFARMAQDSEWRNSWGAYLPGPHDNKFP